MNGEAVPVVMTVTVNFSPMKSTRWARPSLVGKISQRPATSPLNTSAFVGYVTAESTRTS